MEVLDAVDAAADLLLGSRCPGCGAPGIRLCLECRVQLFIRPHRVMRLGLGIPVWAAGWYRPPLSHLVIAFKDRSAWGLNGVLANQLCGCLESGGWGHPVLVPVPSSPASVRGRGFDHTAVLARTLAFRRHLGWTRGLRRTRPTGDQVGRNRRGRLGAQHMSMAARRVGQRIVLVDDVVTTGATLAEAIRALDVIGEQVAGAVVVCDTPGPETVA
ncbi:ComF family protein [Propionibacterium sp. oral taxon 192]|uniref:ComF family protein n=1 Tax=Propionibacterium sp. oral taxon 192 TaxID=671222 RepID=UPI0003A6110A|nr:phosphoribosyltransferase family protein [Propionibacterium sp. oral taxon 192]